jgi:hypothetical protein
MIINLNGVEMHIALQFHRPRILKEVVFCSYNINMIQSCLSMHAFDSKM